jgi:hypothetical protein
MRVSGALWNGHGAWMPGAVREERDLAREIRGLARADHAALDPAAGSANNQPGWLAGRLLPFLSLQIEQPRVAKLVNAGDLKSLAA